MRLNNTFRWILFSLFIIILSSGALALNDCRLVTHDTPPAGYQLTGYVSLQGHYSNVHITGRVFYPYGLFCDDKLVLGRPDEVATFNFSDPAQMFTDPTFGNFYGSGYATFTGIGVLFEGQAKHGFTEGACKIVGGGDPCDAGDVCVLKISNPNQGPVADCNDDARPYQNMFQNKICCTPTEYCRDGIDNTGDGLVDCASPDCHPSAKNLGVSQECTPDGVPGNRQTTEECVVSYNIVNLVTGETETVFNPDCVDHSDNVFYCSYGVNDDGSETGGDGFCCPRGTRAEEDRDNPGVWGCFPFAQCGMMSSLECEADYRLNKWPQWFSSYYSGNDNDWCVSHLPSYFNPIVDLSVQGRSSMGCCFVKHYGEFGFYHKEGNVKIFGYE